MPFPGNLAFCPLPTSSGVQFLTAVLPSVYHHPPPGRVERSEGSDRNESGKCERSKILNFLIPWRSLRSISNGGLLGKNSLRLNFQTGTAWQHASTSGRRLSGLFRWPAAPFHFGWWLPVAVRPRSGSAKGAVPSTSPSRWPQPQANVKATRKGLASTLWWISDRIAPRPWRRTSSRQRFLRCEPFD